MRSRTVIAACWALVLTPALAAAAPQTPAPNTPPTRVVIYPLLVEATVFGASANTSGDDGTGGGAAGHTDVSLNAAYMFGALLQVPHWFVEGNATWARVHARRAMPFTSIQSHIWLADVRGGPTLGVGFSATLGVRRVGVDFDASLTPVVSPTLVAVSTKVGLWDPLVGVDWRRDFGSLRVNANVQAGGFGVGTDVDASAGVHVEWRFIPHATVRVGYQAFYYKWAVATALVDGVPQHLISRQSLHGPSVGVGIEF
jgi:opacity protein-like surface antigen